MLYIFKIHKNYKTPLRQINVTHKFIIFIFHVKFRMQNSTEIVSRGWIQGHVHAARRYESQVA